MLHTVKRDTIEGVQPTPTSTSRTRPHHVDPKTRLLVGAVIGSVVGLVFVVVAILLWRQYRRTARRRENDASRAEQAMGRPSSVYSEQPLSDPFAAEVKTVVSSDDQFGSPPTTPQKQEFSLASPPHSLDRRLSESHDDHTIERDPPMSAEVYGMPDLSRTFVANVRPTTRSPPPLEPIPSFR